MLKIITALLLVFASNSVQLSFPGVAIDPHIITQVRRAHRYLQKELNLYQNRKVNKYTLYLAIDNYEENLFDLREVLMKEISNYIVGSQNLVMGRGNVILGSNNKLAGFNNWILTDREVTSKEVQTNILYIGKWRILLDNIPIIEYRPELAITNMDSEDEVILKNLKGLKDLRRFHRKRRVRMPLSSNTKLVVVP